MKAKARVSKVISELVIEIDQRWTFHEMRGSLVKIAGLLPSEKRYRDENKSKLSEMILGKDVTIDDQLFVAGNTLSALVSYDGKRIQDYFPQRKIPAPEPSRWLDTEENKIIAKVFGGIPISWQNPIDQLPADKKPFWGNIRYPVKFWEKGYKREKKLAEALYSDSHDNKKELDTWFDIFLENPVREAPLIVKGDVGVGKSWWLAHKLMSLPREKYHVIIIDLRYTSRGANLEESVETEINDFLNHYVKDLSWLYPDFEPLYGGMFDPKNPKMKEKMIQKALNYSRSELVNKRLRFYNQDDAPELIVAFDNIDLFKEEEQLTIADICVRIIGHASGVKVVMTMRPSTLFIKPRLGKLIGESMERPVFLKSPDVYDVLRRRLSTNNKGDSLNLGEKIPSTNITWNKLFNIYKKSDYVWGLAQSLRELCCTEKISFVEYIPYDDYNQEHKLHITYDVRHYLKLFRRIIRSNCICGLENIGNIYYGIHALLLRSGEPMNEGDAYLFNLFDNEKPELRGNALVRYRVLEYCSLFHDLQEAFNMYFGALGCGESTARSVLDLFQDSGLVIIDVKENDEGNRIPSRAELTIAGKRHLELVTNMWYIICVKTGMNIFKEYMVYANDAKSRASIFVKSPVILNYYADHGWVPDDLFIKFIGMQENLEERRIGNFQKSHPELQIQVANMMGNKSSPAANIYYEYSQQIEYWRHYNKEIPKLEKERKE